MPPWDERVWEVEVESIDCAALRGVWRYRSSLITGEPAEKHRVNREETQRLFPNWPGFLPERRDPSWNELFLAGKKKLEEDMERLDARINAQMAAAKARQTLAPQGDVPRRETV